MGCVVEWKSIELTVSKCSVVQVVRSMGAYVRSTSVLGNGISLTLFSPQQRINTTAHHPFTTPPYTQVVI